MGSAGRKKILIAEDETELREIWENFLRDQDYDVVGANNGEVGKFMLKLESIDLVISDIKMPKLNGLELTKYVKEQKAIPVILVTGDLALSMNEMVEKTGADLILTKPFGHEDLLLAVNEVLGDGPE